MKSSLQFLNLLGVLALAVLCVAQWHRDRGLNLQLNQLERTRQDQARKFVVEEKMARGATEDLTSLKAHFHQTHADLTQSHTNLRTMERENQQLSMEREQLKSAVTNWANGVAVRDEKLRKAQKELHDLSAQLNDTVQKFNDLATNYNTSIRRFNELATNYNTVVKDLNGQRAGDAGKEAASAKAGKQN